MNNIWLIVAAGALTVSFQALIAAAWIVLGGMGATWKVNQALLRQTDEIHRIDERITREVKTRAAHAGVEARAGGNLKEEAMKIVADEKQAPEGVRPSVRHMLRG